MKPNSPLTTTLIMAGLLSCAMTTVNAAPEISLADALAYQVPESTCEAPSAGGSGDATTAERKQKKAAKRYRKCMKAYHNQLLTDFGRLRSAAAHGLTEAQAQTILTSLAGIQAKLQNAQAQNQVKKSPEDQVPASTTGFWDRAHGR